MDAILFDNVGKRYGALRALEAVTFSVAKGEMFGVIGPDGAGKTTTIRLACGLLRPDTGRITVQGRDPVREHQAITHTVGYLSQRFSLYGDLTIDENIAFFAEIHSVRGYTAARDRLLDMTQLTPFRARRADRLSGGMKQKLALACTLVHEPDILFLDEPIVPRLTLGQRMALFTDAGQRIDGAITFISPKAEFTPRNVQTAEERSKLVYRIKVAVDNREGILKQGMPVDAEMTLP